MSSVFSLQPKKVTLTGDESIQKRPMGPLLEALEGVGVKTTSKNGKPPITVQGPMQGGVIKIRGDVSSQYISGLLIACPLRRHDTTIEITTELKSRPYIDVTLDALADFGVRVDASEDYQDFYVPGDQFYSRGEYIVEGDYSGAAFMLGASALAGKEITVRNLPQQSKQGDRHFLEILKMMDANVRVRGDEVSVLGGSSLRGIDVDLSQTPDLLPITAVMCALARGKSRIHNVEHARIKECDRISAMAQGLKRMGAKVEEKQDGLLIDGVDELQGAQIESFADHRIVMAFAAAALRAKGETTINNAESVAVSYPKFIEDFKMLGAGLKTAGARE
jgi:3-phosphoshikimate 1-carboxyvinyltransferase